MTADGVVGHATPFHFYTVDTAGYVTHVVQRTLFVAKKKLLMIIVLGLKPSEQ